MAGGSVARWADLPILLQALSHDEPLRGRPTYRVLSKSRPSPGQCPSVTRLVGTPPSPQQGWAIHAVNRLLYREEKTAPQKLLAGVVGLAAVRVSQLVGKRLDYVRGFCQNHQQQNSQ